MRRALIDILRLIAATLVLLAATACSDSPEPSDEQPTASGSAPAAPAPPAGPPGQTAEAASCLNGQYRLVRFAGVGEQARYGTGEGGDVVMTFNEGTYELTGAGKEPMTLTIAGQQGRLTVDGAIRGSYTVDGSNVTFTAQETPGSARLRAAGQTVNLSMADLAKVMDPDGGAVVSCSENKLIVAFEYIRLEFERP
jgi:hypothetical protein